MANLSLAQQIQQLEKKLKQYSQVEVPRAAKRAINRVSTKAKTEIVRTVSTELNVKSKILKSQIYVNSTKGAGIRAYIKSYLRPISAVRLLTESVVQKSMGKGTNKRGVKVAGQQFDGAFINRGARGGRALVFQRDSAARYPLRKVTIKIDTSMVAHQLPIAKRFAEEEFQKELIRELQYRISKYV